MARTEITTDGWTLTTGETPEGGPALTATHPDQKPIAIIGEPGLDMTILRDRLLNRIAARSAPSTEGK